MTGGAESRRRKKTPPALAVEPSRIGPALPPPEKSRVTLFYLKRNFAFAVRCGGNFREEFQPKSKWFLYDNIVLT